MQRLHDKWGYIDETGAEVIPCIYDKAENFRGGKAEVSLNKQKMIIDKTGNEMVIDLPALCSL